MEVSVLIITEKIRIYPNKSQRILIDQILWYCKETYNRLLEIHNSERLIDEKKKFSKYDYNRLIKTFEKPKEFQVHSQVLQQVGERLAIAFSRFFGKVSRYPKFKSIRSFRSFTYPQNTGFSLDPIGKRIYLGKFGKVKAVFSRELSGTPKRCTIKKLPCGHYYAFIAVDVGDSPNQQPILVRQRTKIGIDLGVSRFYTTHDGEYLESPRFLRKKLSKLRAAQRKLSRKQKGSNNWRKQVLKVAKLHEIVKNTRRDHHFKVAHYLVNKFDQIACEDLQVNTMFRKKYESKQRRALLDVGLCEFLVILEWMCQKYSCTLTKVPPQYTSQICSRCGSIVKKDLSVRIHNCPHCGLVVDRDINAAVNILNKSNNPVGTTGGVMTEVITPTLVEMSLIRGIN